MNKSLFAACALIAVTGCAGPAKLGAGGDLQAVEPGNFPAPTQSDLIASVRPYLIGPFDKLSIDVFGIEELSKREYQTDASGSLSFPLAGTIAAAGKTPAEVQQLIEDRLRERYIRNPQVTVNLVETGSQVVTVDGQVQQPGLYPVIGRMTLMRAIATAKGTTDLAKMDDVVVFRTVNGTRMAALYNLGAIQRGNYADPEIYANDVVIVDESQARRIFKDLVSLAPTLGYALVTIIR